MGTPIRQGRPFTDRDDAKALPVAIVNETFARQCCPGQSAIGKRVQYDRPNGPFLQVVGVAAEGNSRLSVVVACRGDLGTAVNGVRQAVKSVDPGMPIFETRTMEQFMQRGLMAPHPSAAVAGPAGILAAIIAAIGLYGVMAFSVSRRTQEVGIGVAAGATPRHILTLVMRQGLVLALVGLGIGLVVALASSRMLGILMFGVSPTDPAVFVGVPLLLAAVATFACYVPARRALRVDPLIALRQE